MNILHVNLMHAVLNIINETYTGLPAEDPSRLELVEIRPRSGDFSKVTLSCSIAPNDPADPTNWIDEELAWPGNLFNNGVRQIEMGGGQYFNKRYTVDFNFFFMREGIGREQSIEIAELIFARIHSALVAAGRNQGGEFETLFIQDDLGFSLARTGAARSVKRMQLRPGGSSKKTLYKGKMWLQFETYIE